MQTNQPTQPIQQLPQPTASVSPVRKNSLHAKWEAVDGKLICRWFKDPD